MSETAIAPDGLVEADDMVEVFKALGHPLRFDIMRRMVAVAELPCTELEHALPITKPTISYHVKLLHHAGLINVRRVGKYYFYSPRLDVIERLLPGFVGLLQDGLFEH